MERVRPSATVILTRRAPHLEVYLVERSLRTRFFPGYHAFPGGVLDPEDAGDFRQAAVREVREEIRIELEPATLVDAGRLLTPPFGPLRYDTAFFVADLPPGKDPQVDGEELVSGSWWRPADALTRFEEHAFRIPPPTLAYLHLLATYDNPEKAAAAARATDGRPHHERFRIELHPGVYALPLRTHTLPPATTTNCYLFDGDPVLVVDPGSEDPGENVALTHTLDEMTRDGRDVIVLLTHHHGDHVRGVPLLKERYHAKVLAHAATRDALPDGLVDEVVEDREILDLGRWGNLAWQIQVLHTPGHAPGHLALRDMRWDAIVAGDLVSGVSTILVDPEEGDMTEYMRSLARCASLDPFCVLPAHGPIMPGDAFLKTLEHRQMRERKALAALRSDPQTIEALVPSVYEDTPAAAWGLAERNLESILLHLERGGQARRAPEGWLKA